MQKIVKIKKNKDFGKKNSVLRYGGKLSQTSFFTIFRKLNGAAVMKGQPRHVRDDLFGDC